MNVAGRTRILLVLLAVLAAAAYAQSPKALEESRAFFQDVAGYHAQGSAGAPDRAEAQRLAKAAALRALFSEIGKDSIFAEMCISGWPEYISVEAEITTESEGTYTAQLQVVVATSAIMLTEQKYQVAVLALLNSTEGTLEEIERELAEADELERNLKVSETLGAYRRARTRTAEARELVKDVGDKSVTSDGGSNIAALTARLDALTLRVSGGLERMEAIEREAQKNAAADEMSRAYDLYETALEGMEARAEQKLELSPFYDLPRSKLDSILLDLRADIGRAAQVTEELVGLRGLVAEDRQYLRQKIELSLVDAQALSERLQKMEEEVRAEIRLPRLVRQERAQRRRAALDTMGRAVSWTLLHKPLDIVTLEWDLPLRWDMESPVRATGGLNLRLEAEGSFRGGLWIRGAAGHEESVDAAGVETWASSAWASGFDIGGGRRGVLGIGVTWDWLRRVGASRDRAERELGARLHVGGVDQERGRVGWLLSLGYTVPMAHAPGIVLPYHLNGSLELRIKAADVLIVRASARSKSYQIAPLDPGVAFADAYSYRFDWSVGLGLRLPPPFILGVAYGGQLTAGIGEDGRLGPLDPHVGDWRLSLGYAF